jgi:hypothetical protein
MKLQAYTWVENGSNGVDPRRKAKDWSGNEYPAFQ